MLYSVLHNIYSRNLNYHNKNWVPSTDNLTYSDQMIGHFLIFRHKIALCHLSARNRGSNKTMAQDYLSALNAGSGLNVTQIVDALVDAECTKQKKIDEAKDTATVKISALGSLKTN